MDILPCNYSGMRSATLFDFFPAFCLSSSLIYFSVPLLIYSYSVLVYRRTVQLPMCHLFGISLKITSYIPILYIYIARRFFFSTRLFPRKPRSCLFIFFPPHLFAAEVRSVETVFLLACPQLPALEKPPSWLRSHNHSPLLSAARRTRTAERDSLKTQAQADDQLHNCTVLVSQILKH